MSFLNNKNKPASSKQPKKLANKQDEEQEIKLKKEKWFEPEGELAVDIYQNDDEIIVEAPVAGVKLEDLEVIIENDTIEIKGAREKANKIESENYLLEECYWGSFSRRIVLPVDIDEAKAEATIEQGVLTIRVPKVKKDQQGKKIKIKEK